MSQVQSAPVGRSAPVPPEPTPFRRQPVQQRSAKRVTLMLDSCAELLDEVGYETLSTTMIARRAGVAVGSLYQFFPDKRAVVQALTQRNFERFLEVVRERLNSVDHTHWWDVVDSLLDVYVAMHREVPGFAQVHFGDVVDVHLLDEQRDNNAVVADSIVALLDELLDLPPERVTLPISVAVEAGDTLLKYAFRRNAEGDQQIVDETKHMIKEYLASRFGEK
ncbi:transcriptional regulator, TetR family [Haloechinothrix alba]|uniref:Transcriptional regulator, TetR family n=1 Tax=Haloechinothrix alba TaxID=664784 RepID=A0A238V1D0_9PSEU|nr:transcriptional regulator, TetR family [Haloechinothrix alba]